MAAGTGLIAGTYGLVRLSYGLFLPDISDSLDLGAATAGYISSAASVAYCVGALLGLVADAHPRLLVVGALATGALGAAGMAAAPSTAAFVPAAVVGSAGAGLASPGLVGVVARSVARDRVDRAQAVVNSGTGPGLVLAGVLALLLLPDWRLGFVVGAVFTAAVGVAVLLLDGSRAAGPGARDARTWGWLTALWLPASAALLLGAASASVWTYGRTLLVGEGIGGTAATAAWILVGVGGTATVLTAGRLSRLPAERAWLLTTAATAVAVGALGLGARHLSLALAACLLFGWAFVAATSALIAWVSTLVPDRAAAGTACLFITLTGGQALGSASVGGLADLAGLSPAFAAAAGTAFVAAALSVVPGRMPA